MKQIETIKSGKNYSAVSVGKMSEIIEHVLPMGPNVTIQGKVFAGQAVGATGSENLTMLCIQYKANAFTEADSPMTDGVILQEELKW